jgi:DHA1 family bicyclomycin/chloramphenicol resistance-like MFS transporter
VTTPPAQNPAAPAPDSPQRIGGVLLLVIALLSAIGPIATDMYVPGFPQIEHDLGAAPSDVQLTLSLFMVGMGVGQLFWGPLSDAVGRRRPLLVASALLVLASVGAALAPNISVLIACRFLQGLTGCAGVVISRAIPRDLTSGRELGQAFGLLGIIQGMAPVISPIAGGIVVSTAGWHVVMWIIAAATVLMLIGVVLVIVESLPRDSRRTLTPHRLGSTVAALARDRVYVGSALALVFSFGVMFSYISGSSFILQRQYGLNTIGYTLCFAANATGMLLIGNVNRSALQQRTPATMQRLMSTVILAGAVALGICALVSARPPLILVLAIILVTTGAAVASMANLTTLAMQARSREEAGLASALIGALQFLGAGTVTTLVSVGGSPSVRSVATVMLISAALAAASFFGLANRRAARP